MKNLKYMGLLLAIVSIVTIGFTACGSDDDDKDMTPPVISSEGLEANPINCQEYHRGDVIPFQYLFTDNKELGNFNIEIHNNADHHSHSTEADDHDHDGSECEEEHDHDHDDDADDSDAAYWVYNESFPISAGQRSHMARLDIPVPANIKPGDYHFMIRLTDRAGWQQLKAVAIKIE